MQFITTRGARVLLISAAALALAATPVLARVGAFSATTTPVQDGGGSGLNVTGTATLTLHGNQLTAHIEASGLSPNLPHLMHIHGTIGMENDCPSPVSAFDDNNDGFIDTAEGLPAYGPIDVTFSTFGSTTPGNALNLDAAAVADGTGHLTYDRTFKIPGKVAVNLDELHVVIHGADLDGSTEYDGVDGSLGAGIPLEAEIPVSCGAIN
jgi:hypothetical protein